MEINKSSSAAHLIPEKWREPAAVAVLFTASAGMVYIVGWSFNIHYYAAFGIGLSTADVAEYIILISGVHAIVNNIFYSILCIVLSVIVCFCAWSSYNFTKSLNILLRSMLTVPILTLSFIVIIHFFYQLGKNAGEQQIHQEISDQYRDSPSVFIIMKESARDQIAKNPILDMTFEEIRQGCFRLMSIRQNGLFLFRASNALIQEGDNPSSQRRDFIFIPIRNVHMIRTKHGMSVCK